MALDSVVEYAGPETPLSAVREASVRLGRVNTNAAHQ